MALDSQKMEKGMVKGRLSVKKLLWLIEVIILFIFLFLLSLIPYRFIKTTAKCISNLYYLLKNQRLSIARRNVKSLTTTNIISASKTPKQVIKEGLKNIGRSIIELAKVYYGSGDKVLKSVSIEGREHFEKAREKGKGIIFITGHCGNWELMGLALSLKIDKISIIARPFKNPYLDSLVNSLRKKYGNQIIYKEGAVKNTLRILESGGSVMILIDQAVFPADFLGRPRVAVFLAKKSSSPVLPIFIKREGLGHCIRIMPQVEFSQYDEEDTKKLSSFITGYIRENPSEWLWIHRRWKRGPTPS